MRSFPPHWLVAVWAVCCLSDPLGAAENWPEFRGPHGDGHATGAPPLVWSETQGVKWKTPIHGKGWSSPVVWGNQVWLTTAPPDGKQLDAVCVDAGTGRIQHDIKVFDNPFPQYCIDRNSYASPTPAIEQGRVYVHYGAHGTACLDTQTGKVVWSRRDLPCFHHRGPASSPILFENLLILTFDGFDVQYLVALDKATGQTVWKRDRDIAYDSDNGDIKKAYSTPTIVPVGDSLQLVSPSAGAAMGYDPRTGEELWRVKCGGMNVSARPVFGRGLVFMTTADGGFIQYALRPDGRGDVTSSHVAWKNTKGVAKHSSPILVEDLLFMANEQGIVTCVDAASGDVQWQKRAGGSFTASPIFAAGRVYLFSEDGNTLVIAPKREFEQLAANKLEQGCMASPAVIGNSLLVRTIGHLYRIE
jgi:outer membrane protein assembly factor BamB